MDYAIQLNYYEYLNYFDYTNLLMTTKKFYYNYQYNNDNIYKLYLEDKFSKQFIIKAKPIIISYYDCFLRIVNFEKFALSLQLDLWNEETYYAFWKLSK